MEKTLSINLTPFCSSRKNILIGTLEGEHIRMILKLDTVDQWLKKNQDLQVEFEFPENVYHVSDSFLKGLLNDSYKILGNDTFIARVKFYSGNEILKDKISSEISQFIRVMKMSNR